MKLYNIIRYWFRLLPMYLRQMRRFHNSTLFKDNEESSIGMLTMAFHTIEKGFSMPDFHPGFGASNLKIFLDNAEKYVNEFGTKNIQIQHIAEIVNDYKKCHLQIGYKIDSELKTKMDGFLSHFAIIDSDDVQIDECIENFFCHNNDDFLSFSQSRHSCRNFSDVPVEISTIRKAVELAQSAPSACNRQPSRVYVVSDRDKISRILALHKGNRGFGHRVDKLLVISGFLGCYNATEFNSVFIDCGIFTMNLVYALHYYKIGACILNWSVPYDKDKTIRTIIPVPEKEQICVLIACGNVPEQFKVCRSGKKSIESIFRTDD